MTLEMIGFTLLFSVVFSVGFVVGTAVATRIPDEEDGESGWESGWTGKTDRAAFSPRRLEGETRPRTAPSGRRHDGG